ncbi:MAG: FAD-binding oxidoreductase, partial [Paracoccaceae bacterium]
AFCPDAPAYLIIESTLQEDELLGVLAPFFESDDILDAVLAKSDKEAGEIWRLREDSQAAARTIKNPLWYDVSIPLSRLDTYVTGFEDRLDAIAPDARHHVIAHLGDGNLHISVGRAVPWSTDEKDHVSRAVEHGVKAMGGAVSAEHGIGTFKLDTFARNTTPGNLAAMRAIKAALDPNGILNPGKVIPGASS